MNEIKLMVAIPSRDTWKSDFGVSLATMLVATACAPKDYELDLLLHNAKGASLAMNRIDLCRFAIDRGCTHLLFLDDDMRIPADTALKLISTGKQIIGANCARREYPPAPTAKGFEGQMVFTRQSSTGLQKVKSVGTGIMLIDVSVFAKIPEPWFCEDPVNRIGEDVWFCNSARNAGLDIWIDHDLSKGVVHIGEFDYSHQKISGWKQ